MPVSILDQILTATANQVTNLNLANGSATVSVAIRKLPRVDEDLDVLPLVAVNTAVQPEPTKPIAFNTPGANNFLTKTYLIDVTVISAGNQDFTSTNIDVYGTWREQIINAFRPEEWGSPIFGITQCYDLDVTPDVFLDRKQLNESYDYQAVRLAWKTEE